MCLKGWEQQMYDIVVTTTDYQELLQWCKFWIKLISWNIQ